MSHSPSTNPTLAGSLLEWDSDFFGRRIGRVDADSIINNAAAVDAWCADEAIECAYLLVSTADPLAMDAAGRLGFRLVDVRVTLERRLGLTAGSDEVLPTTGRLRSATENDIERLRAIAEVSHTDSRFYADRQFDREKCRELYALWIEKSCRGWADHVVVAEWHGHPAGYVSCHVEGEHGRIGLVGVDASSRGIGLGPAMVREAARWLAARGATHVSVATQGRNVAAIRLYEKCGFLVSAVDLWYHRWHSAGDVTR